MAKRRIIVLGGGFAGVKCSRSLRSIYSEAECDIVVFSRENHMVFYPLLAEVAAAAMNPKDMAAPLRQLLAKVHCRTEEVVEINLGKNEIVYQTLDGEQRNMSYDELVISSGNMTNLAFIPGMADHALPLKSMGDALNIQARVISQMEHAEIAETAEKKKWCLTFVIVGGGFSGVELAGELNDLLKSSCRYYTNFTRSDIEVILVHSHDQILPEVSSSLRDFALKNMEKQGVKFRLKSSAAVCTPEGVKLKDGTFLRAGTVVCTIGSRALPMIERLDVAKEKNRIVVDPDMRIPGFENAWAIGDCAAVTNAVDGQLSPTTGQFAERQGAQVAKNIANKISGKPTKPFSHQSLGTLCSIGGKNAVAEMFNIRISGFLAWFVWRGVYLFKLPSLGQKIKVSVTWFFDLLFPPQLTSLSIDATTKIGKAHYSAGDFIFKSKDPATDFYIVEEGEVEIHSAENPEKDQIVAILGVGEFFGESCLMERKAHRHAAKAKTDCEILVLGKNIFGQISESLVPFKQALATATMRRTDLFQNFPEAAEIVRRIPLSQLIEPLITEPMTPDTPLMKVVQTINSKRLDHIYIVDEEQKLVGLVTRTDLMRWGEVIAARPGSKNLNLVVRDLMVPAPTAVSKEDDTAFVLATMRTRGLKRLPVIDKDSKAIIGMIRIENAMQKILESIATAQVH